MGAENIQDQELESLNIEIVDNTESDSRKLKIPKESLSSYIEHIKTKLNKGFWNEIIGSEQILFIFKLPDGTIKEYKLSPSNEAEIDQLCAELNNEPPDKTANVYKYISDNDFYHEFMLEHYADLINR